jgi:putative RecB family exonuclease
MTPEDERRLRWQVWWCIEALWKMEDPSAVELAGIEQKLEATIGPAILLGIIDRWQVKEDGTALIGDYKTGKVAKPRYEAEKRFQLGVYTVLIESVLDISVTEAELLYLKEGVRWSIQPSEDLRSKVKVTVERVWNQIAESCSLGRFEAKPSVLCDWCAYKGICPQWKR